MGIKPADQLKCPYCNHTTLRAHDLSLHIKALHEIEEARAGGTKNLKRKVDEREDVEKVEDNREETKEERKKRKKEKKKEKREKKEKRKEEKRKRKEQKKRRKEGKGTGALGQVNT